MLLAMIIAATLAGGVLSVLAAALVSMAVIERWVPRLVSFAVGGLLGVALLELLPHALESQAGTHAIFGAVLGGMLTFFVLEKLALWRHDHDHGHGGHVHAPDRAARPAGLLILVGDSLHNFVDGVLIAAAFLADPALGWAAAGAVIAHEVPQEVGDFIVLLRAGYTRRRALVLNVLSSLAAVVGGVLGYFALGMASAALPYVLALAAAGFLYIAVADLIPVLHRERSLGDAALQLGLIAAGIVAVTLAAHRH